MECQRMCSFERLSFVNLTVPMARARVVEVEAEAVASQPVLPGVRARYVLRYAVEGSEARIDVWPSCL